MTMQPVRSGANFAAFILAGGKSTRMGADKAFLLIDGQTLLHHALELAHSVTPNVSIVGDRSKFGVFGTVIEDLLPNCGPLGGIHAALRSSQADCNLFLAIDTPFISASLLHYLITQAEGDSDTTVTVPRTGGWQPLCAVYRRDFAVVAEAAILAGNFRIDALFTQVKVRVIDDPELLSAGFSPRMFFNLNTPDDVAAASAMPVMTE